jgi:hypothetical protein
MLVGFGAWVWGLGLGMGLGVGFETWSWTWVWVWGCSWLVVSLMGKVGVVFLWVMGRGMGRILCVAGWVC